MKDRVDQMIAAENAGSFVSKRLARVLPPACGGGRAAGFRYHDWLSAARGGRLEFIAWVEVPRRGAFGERAIGTISGRWGSAPSRAASNRVEAIASNSNRGAHGAGVHCLSTAA